jgi:hypothetical protein
LAKRWLLQMCGNFWNAILNKYLYLKLVLAQVREEMRAKQLEMELEGNGLNVCIKKKNSYLN